MQREPRRDAAGVIRLGNKDVIRPGSWKSKLDTFKMETERTFSKAESNLTVRS